MAREDECTVGQLRQQSALCDADRRVILVQRNRDGKLVRTPYRVVRCYPDTTDEHGNFNSTFKLEVEVETGE